MDSPVETHRARRPLCTPYRTAGERGPFGAAADDPPVDGDVAGFVLAFWLVSLVRVAGAVVRNETFATEASLALIAVVSLPWLLHGSLRAYGRRAAKRWRRTSSGEGRASYP